VSAEEIRRRNLVPAGAMPWRNPAGATQDSGDYAAAMDRALDLADAAGFAARRAESAARGRLRGLGIANCIEQCGSGFEEGAELVAEPDGGVTVLIGTKSSGQSHETVYAQLAAEALGLAPDAVRVVQGDTDLIARGNGTGACRSLTTGGSALLRAAAALLEEGRRRASARLEADAADIAYAAGRFAVAGTDHAVTLAALAEAAPLRAEGRFAPPPTAPGPPAATWRRWRWTRRPGRSRCCATPSPMMSAAR